LDGIELYIALAKVRYLEADTLSDEILRTFSLLFTRDLESKNIAKRLFASHNATLWIVDHRSLNVDNNPSEFPKTRAPTRKRLRTVVIPEWALFFQEPNGGRSHYRGAQVIESTGQLPMYSHFDYYAGHFAVVKKQMLEWKPRTFREMFQPAYADRFSWFATWVSITFAGLGVIAIVTSIMQTYWAYEATAATVQSLMLQKQEMNQRK